ncbi:hypothetical protein [Senegalia massiliensis]|uniref:hypothetical protein n=1 Tax=Senegalia massiliensis TaxID=1720316 RepID=UPI001032602C|nr:hypothetical protein [Senegalia massiliensis]
MEQIIKKIIDIDKEATDLEQRTKDLIEQKQNNLRMYFQDIEDREQKKAEEKIQKETNFIRQETYKTIKFMENKKEKKISNFKQIYSENKDEIIEKALKEILEI